MAGSTTSVSSVEVTSPPMTTVASGRCTSAPFVVEMAMGRKPNEATRAVVSTGRSLARAPSSIRSFQVEAIAATQTDELIHQHKAVEYRHTEQRDETDACRNAERKPAQFQGQYPTYCGQRHRCENDQCLTHGVERQVEQEEDEQQQRHGHGYHQAGGGVLQVLELTLRR
jgi:hypothetical protein